jgi:hypothetical protein
LGIFLPPSHATSSQRGNKICRRLVTDEAQESVVASSVQLNQAAIPQTM